jgi:beta-xylosidase
VNEFPCVNFRALDDDGTSNPPDVNGAIGFDYLMTTLNTQVRIQNKQGTVISTVSLDGFWDRIGHTDIFDPKITYDPYGRRWILFVVPTAGLQHLPYCLPPPTHQILPVIGLNIL